MPKICVISGSRADEAALAPVIKALNADQIPVDTLASRNRADSAFSCAQAMTMATEGLEKLKPDLVILGGDRFEILGATIATYLMGIPIAHLSGGDITEGSQDDGMRHAISKLASLHLVTNEASGQVLKAMGEEHWRVHVVGAPQIDNLLSQELYTLHETLSHLGFMYPRLMDEDYILVAYQPPTAIKDPTSEIDGLLDTLKKTGMRCIFTTVNTDAGGIEITRKILKFCNQNPSKYHMARMDHKLFLSAMKHCQYMIGNSSAGFYEAPTLGVKFVNVGERQKGRVPIKGDGKATEKIKYVIESMMLIPKETLVNKKWSHLCSSIQGGSASTANVPGVDTQKRNWSDGPAEISRLGESLISGRVRGRLLGF